MLKITTESGRVYLVDETEGAERFLRMEGSHNPFVPEHLTGAWLPLMEGSRYTEVGRPAKIKYGARWSEYILTTPVVSVEEIPDE